MNAEVSPDDNPGVDAAVDPVAASNGGGAGRRVAGWLRTHPLAPAGRLARVVCVVALVLVGGGATTAVTLDRIQAVPVGAAYRYSDTVVTEAQLARRVTVLKVLYGIAAPQDPAGQDKFRRDTAQAIAVNDLIDSAAAERGITVPDQAVAPQLDALIQKVSPGGRAPFEQALSQAGMNLTDLSDELKRQQVDAELFKQVTVGVRPATDQEVAAAYDQRRAQMVSPEKRHLRNIAVADQGQAQQIADQLAAGADFATLAGQYSLDTTSKANGGDLGDSARSDLEQAYGDAAFSAPVNSVFGPVQTRNGWSVGQVLGSTPAAPLSLDQVREQLRSELFGQRRQDAWNAWLTDRIKTTHLRYADNYRPADPSAISPGLSPGG